MLSQSGAALAIQSGLLLASNPNLDGVKAKLVGGNAQVIPIVVLSLLPSQINGQPTGQNPEALRFISSMPLRVWNYQQSVFNQYRNDAVGLRNAVFDFTIREVAIWTEANVPTSLANDIIVTARSPLQAIPHLNPTAVTPIVSPVQTTDEIVVTAQRAEPQRVKSKYLPQRSRNCGL